MKTAVAPMVSSQKKLFYRINEVSELTGVKPYVLRYWETEFPELDPEKDASDHRRYRAKDVKTVLAIRKLLYEDRFTIKGARQRLKLELRRMAEAEGSPAEAPLAAPTIQKVEKPSTVHPVPKAVSAHGHALTNGHANGTGSVRVLHDHAPEEEMRGRVAAAPAQPAVIRPIRSVQRPLGETLSLLRGEVNELLRILNA